MAYESRDWIERGTGVGKLFEVTGNAVALFLLRPFFG